MDTLNNERYNNFDYICRYTPVPFYYDTLNERDVFGVGTNMYKDISYVTHKLDRKDTLDSLSLKYYNNPTYWWVIAYYNDIQDAFIKLMDYYETIRIPSISAIKFGKELK